MSLILAKVVAAIFAGCSSPTEEFNIRYKVLRTSQEPVEYRVVYTTSGTTTKQEGPVTTWWWESDLVVDFPSGNTARLEIEILRGDGTFEVTIFRDGGE